MSRNEIIILLLPLAMTVFIAAFAWAMTGIGARRQKAEPAQQNANPTAGRASILGATLTETWSNFRGPSIGGFAHGYGRDTQGAYTVAETKTNTTAEIAATGRPTGSKVI